MNNEPSVAEAQNVTERNEVAEDFDPNVVIFACRH